MHLDTGGGFTRKHDRGARTANSRCILDRQRRLPKTLRDHVQSASALSALKKSLVANLSAKRQLSVAKLSAKRIFSLAKRDFLVANGRMAADFSSPGSLSESRSLSGLVPWIVSRVPPASMPVGARPTILPSSLENGLLFPYVRARAGEAISCRKTLRPLGVGVAHRASPWKWTLCTAGLKDSIPEKSRKGVIYRVPCKECDAVYIGETLHNLEERLKEHKRHVEKSDPKGSAIAEHVLKTGHSIAWDKV